MTLFKPGMIEWECWSCHLARCVKEEYAGDSTNCPVCGRRDRVPERIPVGQAQFKEIVELLYLVSVASGILFTLLILAFILLFLFG